MSTHIFTEILKDKDICNGLFSNNRDQLIAHLREEVEEFIEAIQNGNDLSEVKNEYGDVVIMATYLANRASNFDYFNSPEAFEEAILGKVFKSRKRFERLYKFQDEHPELSLGECYHIVKAREKNEINSRA